MKKSDLNFQFPDSLIATQPVEVSRILSALSAPTFAELNWEQLLNEFQSNDLLIINDTKVLPRRVFQDVAVDPLEVLFLSSTDQIYWKVMFPAKKMKIGGELMLPKGVKITLLEKGLPQTVKSSVPLTEEYFEAVGDIPLPPYIQKMRQERRSQSQDRTWYQTHWAEKGGSFAAPTASLHFKQNHLDHLRARGVQIAKVTLHVGLGTFLPVHAEDLKDHKMHAEEVLVPQTTWEQIQITHQRGGKVWAMGTTVTRALESAALGLIPVGLNGATDLLILPGFEFKIVDRLLTNFHQPESTLLALVYAFASKENVIKGYEWAIGKQFRLFSYGDLSIWKRA